jgi:hypothetical protein
MNQFFKTQNQQDYLFCPIHFSGIFLPQKIFSQELREAQANATIAQGCITLNGMRTRH